MKMRTLRSSLIIQIFLGSFVFFSSVLLSVAQGQQPLELIDFEHFSAAYWPYQASPPLQALSATISGGVVVTSQWSPLDGGNVYVTTSACNGCLPTITINFNQPISNFSVLLLNGNYSTATFSVSDDQGGQQQIALEPYGYFREIGTVSLPETNIHQVTITGSGCWGIDNVQFKPSGVVLLDPVDSGLLSGAQVTTDTNLLSQAGITVQGAAADGVTQAVLRIPANFAGESLSVVVLNELGSQDTVANDGGLFAVGGFPPSAASTLNVTAANTPNGPMAFVIYLSPVNFARNPQSYPQDSGSAKRIVNLRVQSNNNPNYVLTDNATVFRPPVVLVHGL